MIHPGGWAQHVIGSSDTQCLWDNLLLHVTAINSMMCQCSLQLSKLYSIECINLLLFASTPLLLRQSCSIAIRKLLLLLLLLLAVEVRNCCSKSVAAVNVSKPQRTLHMGWLSGPERTWCSVNLFAVSICWMCSAADATSAATAAAAATAAVVQWQRRQTTPTRRIFLALIRPKAEHLCRCSCC